mgnify:CR=1 FL=1
MAQRIIDLGTSPNKGDGDPLRTAFTKINDNFTELYTGSPIVPQDLRGSVFGDDSTLLVDGVNSSIPKANIEDSANWDTAFAWGNHSTAGYALQATTYTKTEVDLAIAAVDPFSGDVTGSVFADDSTLLVDGVNGVIPKANIESSTHWDTAFGWGMTPEQVYLPIEHYYAMLV